VEAWKKRLYAGYVSTGQATGRAGDAGAEPAQFDINRYGHLVAMLLQTLPESHEVRILDLACGHGPLLLCAKALGYTRLAGVDVSGEQVRLAHSLGLPEVVCGELLDYLGSHPASFDRIYALDVLEHLTMPELLACMDGVGAALAPGGRVVIHVPNAEGLFGMRVRFGDLTHETAFTSVSITQLLRATGFEDIQCREDRPRANGLKSAVRAMLWSVLTLPSRLLLAAETGCFGHLLSQNIWVEARKADRLRTPASESDVRTATTKHSSRRNPGACHEDDF